MRLETTLTVLLACGTAAAQPVIDIPGESLPSESFFAANPGATVNVNAGGVILPGEFADPFGFNGAIVNINADGASGFDTLDHFVEDVTYNLDGGELIRARFTATVGTTTLNIYSGSVERGLTLSGNTAATILGGSIGLVAQGLPAFTAEDDATVAMSGGFVDAAVLLRDNAQFTMSGGTIDGKLVLEDDTTATLSGGTINGIDGRVADPGCTLNITGATIAGTAFVVAEGTLNMSAGAIAGNAGMVSGGIDPTFNMTGGALGTGFRAYDGTINISGGAVGDGFRLGRPTGDGSGVTCNLTVKSASIDSVPLPLSRVTPTTITVRGGAFLSATLLDDTALGLHLNDAHVPGEDRVRAGAVLTIILGPCDADVTGDGSLNNADVNAFVTAFLAQDAAADLNDDGMWNNTDINAFVSAFLAGCD